LLLTAPLGIVFIRFPAAHVQGGPSRDFIGSLKRHSLNKIRKPEDLSRLDAPRIEKGFHPRKRMRSRAQNLDGNMCTFRTACSQKNRFSSGERKNQRRSKVRKPDPEGEHPTDAIMLPVRNGPGDFRCARLRW
jgi:hypothetical protein